MAFLPALCSLFRTIEYLEDSQISLDVPTTQIRDGELCDSLEELVTGFSEEFVGKIKNCNRERVNALDEQIRDALHKLEDKLESHVSDLLLSQSEESVGNETHDHPSLYCLNPLDIEQDIQILFEDVLTVMDEYFEELDKPLPDQEKKDEDDDAVSSRIACGGQESTMVGLLDKLDELKYKLTHREGEGLLVTGMPGIGKTTLVKKIFEDPLFVSHFDCRAWVTVGRNSQLEETLRHILAQVAPDSAIMALLTERLERKTRHLKASLKKTLQRILPHVNPDSDEMPAPHSKSSLKKTVKGILAHVNIHSKKMLVKGYQKIARHSKESLKKMILRILAQELKRCLMRKRYLIVLDDVWYETVFEKLVDLLPVDNNGSKLLLTSRVRRIKEGNILLNMRLMNEDESWNLLCDKVFAEESCPLQLVETGKKIVNRCEGLPLTIITVANLLSQAEKTIKYWSEVATQKKHQLFIDAHDEISKVLYSSYDALPRFLTTHFLYMGVFPQSYEVPQSKIMNLWAADGSLLDDRHYLEVLIACNLVMPCRESTSHSNFISTHQTKTCRLHSSMWHLSNKEARKNKFLHILNDRPDGLEEGMKSQRRLCIHNNILFGIKDVYNSIENNCALTARSLLCFGPYHQYPVPICSNLGLLRVLDALTIRLYEFPIQLLKLVLLRYLALTYNGKLPTSISKLCNLQFLIVHQHLSIKMCGGPSYLPMEIWHMKALKHLQVMGSDLPDPCGASLPKLLTLLDVSFHSCTKNVLEAIPNLKKLGIRTELVHDVVEPLSCFDHISCLHELVSLKCVFVNPEHRPDIVAPLVSFSNFPSNLRKLTLSGLGYPWKEMNEIASLPNLEVLKLRCYAFRGPMWEVEEKGFKNLIFLLIEDTDLVQWKVGRESFRNLQWLSMKHCYKLEEINGEFDRYLDYKLEIVDCNPLVVSWANKIKEVALEEYPNLDVHIHSSWVDGKLGPRYTTWFKRSFMLEARGG